MQRQSDSIVSLAKALSKAQGEVENATKSATNPHFRSKYADLAEIINTVRPVFSKHGLSIIQSPSYEGGVVYVETALIHDSGEWIRDMCSCRIGKDDAQGLGSAVTYLRRYSLAGFCNIAQEDDDGNAASKGKSSAPAPEPSSGKVQYLPPEPEVASPFSLGTPSDGAPAHKYTVADWAHLADARKKTSEALGKEVTDEDLTAFGLVRFGKDSKKNWTKAEFDECLSWLRVMFKSKEWIGFNPTQES